MMILVYDGSYDGFLTAVYDAFYLKQPDICIRKESQCVFLSLHRACPTDGEKAARVSAAIRDKLTLQTEQDVYTAWLSEQEDIESAIVEYLKLAFHKNRNISDMLYLPIVKRVIGASSKVLRENHRFLGILRFAQMGDCLVADMAPDTNILPLLYAHFADRLKNEQFIIRDNKRGYAYFFRQGKGIFAPFHKAEGQGLTIHDEYESLWRQYYKNIAIAERKNVSLRNQFIPKKYHQYVVEIEK